MAKKTAVSKTAPIRRFAAEFLVIVMGILVALAVDAALEARAERQQERTYYQALALDLAEDIKEYDFSLRMLARSDDAARQVRSAVLQESLESPRSLAGALVYSSWVNYPGWTSGTIDELFSAGTIRLIRDQQIKEAIHEYRATVAEWGPRLQSAEFDNHLRYRRMADRLVPFGPRLQYMQRLLDDPPLETPELNQPLARRLAGDETLLAALEDTMVQWAMIERILQEHRRLAAALIEQIEARIDR